MSVINCTTCKNELVRNNSQIKASKTGNFFCNRECRVKWDSQKFKDNRFDYKCPICNNTLKLSESIARTKKFCSLKCSAKYKNTKGNTEVSCDYCNGKFNKLNSKITEKNFCKKSCSTLWVSENLNTQVIKNCIICDKDYIVGKNRENNTKTCSKDCHYEHIRILSTEGHMAEQLRQNGIKAFISQKKSDTLPERYVQDYLEKECISFESQLCMYNKFIVDFYLIDFDVVLEVYGDYWHCNPKFYGYEDNKKEPNKYQIKQMKKDKARKSYLTKCGHNFTHLWEDDIYKNLEEIIKPIINQNP